MFRRRSVRIATPLRLMLRMLTSDAKVILPWSPSTTKRGSRRLLDPSRALATISSMGSVPADRRFVQVDVDLLDLQVLVRAPRAELAADARHLVAAPGRLDVGRLHVVDP